MGYINIKWRRFEVNLITKPRGRGLRSRQTSRFMMALLLRANYRLSKMSINAEKMWYTRNSLATITFNIIKKYLGPFEPQSAAVQRICLIASMSGSLCSKSWEANAIQNVECPLSKSCCMKVRFSTQGRWLER